MKKRIAAVLLLAMFCTILAGCSAEPEQSSAQPAAGGWEPLVSSSVEPASSAAATPESAVQPTPTPSAKGEDTPSAEDVPSTPASQPEDAQPAPSAAEAVNFGVTLYIGTKAGGFQEYPCTLEGEVTPEGLIQGIADLTGWDLTLAEPVATGKGGMSVCLAESSALFQGPPENQKDEFHMYGTDQMAETVLDSIQKTLQENFTGAGGNPDNIDIYFYMEGEQPLSLPDIGFSWPLDQPYQWSAAQQN